MQKVVSISKYEDREKAIRWLDNLPRKYNVQDIKNYLSILKKGYFLFWTEERGLKILK